jgi:hypothetical protein
MQVRQDHQVTLDILGHKVPKDQEDPQGLKELKVY